MSFGHKSQGQGKRGNKCGLFIISETRVVLFTLSLPAVNCTDHLFPDQPPSIVRHADDPQDKRIARQWLIDREPGDSSPRQLVDWLVSRFKFQQIDNPRFGKEISESDTIIDMSEFDFNRLATAGQTAPVIAPEANGHDTTAEPRQTTGEGSAETSSSLTLADTKAKLMNRCTIIPNQLLLDDRLCHGSKVLYAILLSLDWNKKWCSFYSQESLAYFMGIKSARMIQIYLDKLRQYGYIASDRRGLKRTNIIHTLVKPNFKKEEN